MLNVNEELDIPDNFVIQTYKQEFFLNKSYQQSPSQLLTSLMKLWIVGIRVIKCMINKCDGNLLQVREVACVPFLADMQPCHLAAVAEHSSCSKC